jgi:hypothetical protein
MLDTKTQNQASSSTEVKTTKSKVSIQKPNHKKWWIGGLVLVLLFAVGGTMISMMNQKTSKSQASLCKPNEKATNCVKPKPTLAPKLPVKKPLIQPVKPVVAPAEINPYTGEKQ